MSSHKQGAGKFCPSKKNVVIYPGGKGSKLDKLGPHLDSILEGATEFHDVFVGGGGVTLGVARHYPNVRLYVNDLDPWVAARFRVTVGGVASFEEFLRLLPSSLTPEVVAEAEAVVRAAPDEVVLAAAGVVLSRVRFSGNRRGGLRSNCNVRYRRAAIEKEARRERALLLGRLTVACLDFRAYFERLGEPRKDRALYLDPPYVEAGPGLYVHAFGHADHASLASLVAQHPRAMVSYDDHPLVRGLYDWAECYEISTRYDGSRKKATELVFVNSVGEGAVPRSPTSVEAA
jgi:DNA adenine methylase